MANPVVLIGKSGSGKSTAIEGFGETEALINNIEGKPLPFRKKFTYMMKSDNCDTIIAQGNKAYEKGIKVMVIDDAGYIMTHYFMDHHREKKGNQSFEMYDTIADLMYNLVKRVKNELPEDMIVYLLFHEDTDESGNTSLLTLGKLLDRKVNLVGMVTIVLRCMSDHGKHFFRTVTDGSDVVKTPRGMFEEEEIPNDLKAVDTAIRGFYGWS